MLPYYNSGPGPSGYGKDGAGPSGLPSGSDHETNPVLDSVHNIEHLATFTVTQESGILYPADGMRRLLQLEKKNGIWSQKMQLQLARNWVLIRDRESGVIMERFPTALIQDPTAFTSRDPMEMYNNILVFTVADETGSGQRAEMHIFQCQSISAQELVEDLKVLQMGKLKPGGSLRCSRAIIPPPPDLPPPAPPMSAVPQRTSMFTHAKISDDGEENNDGASSTSSDKYEREVIILNHCFDDIEKFIARLQHAAAACRELERRRQNSRSKKQNLGDGMLTMRSKPPLELDFIDIFQKFKLSFSLLAGLRSHIHDPNAPELVHFLFTPLALIIDACRESNYDPNLASRVISPLLTREAINLLINCVTSKETELWHSLGDSWLVPRDQWKEHVPAYHPVFLDGWSPEYSISEDLSNHDNLTSLLDEDKQKTDSVTEQQTVPYYGHRELEESHYSSDYLDFETREERATDYFERSYGPESDLFSRDDPDQRADQTRALSDISVDSIERSPRGASGINRTQESWLDDLLARQVKIVRVTYPRTANNDKELSVFRGEYLEVLEDHRNWWKVKNSKGQVAHVPNTILTHYDSTLGGESDAFNNPTYMTRSQEPGQSYNYEDSEEPTMTSDGAEAVHRPNTLRLPAPADWVRKERLGKKDCSVWCFPTSQTSEESSSDFDISQSDERPLIPRAQLKSSKTCEATSSSAAEPSQRPLPDLPLARNEEEPKYVPPITCTRPPTPTCTTSFWLERLPSTSGSSSSESNRTGAIKKSSTNSTGTDKVNKQKNVKFVITLVKEEAPHYEQVKEDPILDERTPPKQVQEWLTSKGFLNITSMMFKDMNGAALFRLTKCDLMRCCGHDEGKRLNKELKQCKIAAGYPTSKCAQLKLAMKNARENPIAEEPRET